MCVCASCFSPRSSFREGGEKALLVSLAKSNCLSNLFTLETKQRLNSNQRKVQWQTTRTTQSSILFLCRRKRLEIPQIKFPPHPRSTHAESLSVRGKAIYRVRLFIDIWCDDVMSLCCWVLALRDGERSEVFVVDAVTGQREKHNKRFDKQWCSSKKVL